MYTITKQFHFSASHILHGLPDTHPCSRMHGHNYLVEIELKKDCLDQNGFVVDYHELNKFKDFLKEHFDHRHLNDIVQGENPTAEVLAKFFYDWCRIQWNETTAVRVMETPRTSAEYRD